MMISPFWLRFLKEAKDAEAYRIMKAETYRIAKEVVSAFSAEADAHALYEEQKETLATWGIWNYSRAQEMIQKFTEALTCWYRVIEYLFDYPDDIWEVLSTDAEVVEHACFTRQVHLSRMISTILMEQLEWNQRRLTRSKLDKAATLFEEKERGENPL